MKKDGFLPDKSEDRRLGTVYGEPNHQEQAGTHVALFDWPGKSPDQHGIEHPAAYHMLDVAAVAEQLIAPLDRPPSEKAFLALAAALHDLGKISDSFRDMLREGQPQTAGRHWEVTEFWLRTFDSMLADTLPDPDFRRALYAAIAGQHGRPPRLEEFRKLKRAAGAAARQDAETLLLEFQALWPDARLDMSLADAPGYSWWLPGLITVADWIGSNTEYFPAVPAGPCLAEYLALARDKAAVAVLNAGLGHVVPSQQQVIEETWSLRPMQSAARDVTLPDGPTLALIEDETGSGKTEAALILAQRMMLAGKGDGMYFALPTMATANAMFARAEAMVGRLFETPPSLALAHGRAALSERFRSLIRAPSAPGQPDCTSWLADDRRRALLATIGIGTIDQALLSALPVRHAMLRHYALARKILIVDEVHEMGDPYMAESLCRLLQLHRRMGGSAILMTATMPVSLRDRLCRAFGEVPPDGVDYPALTIAGHGQITTKAADNDRGPIAVARLKTATNAIEMLGAAAEGGAACLWVRNAVDDAIAACAALRDKGVQADLLHARFALCDRLRHEAGALQTYGKARAARPGRVLVATQVVESSLDLDFDVMVSDLAPVAAVVQRAGRLWRHMDLRPAGQRAVPRPILHVLSPDPGRVDNEDWLAPVFDRGAFTYPVDLQWRAANALFKAGQINAPAGLRQLIEEGLTGGELPAALQLREQERLGKAAAENGLAGLNLVPLDRCYRQIEGFSSDADFPTRLGIETRILLLARETPAGLEPWAGAGWSIDNRQRSEVSSAASRLGRLSLPDKSDPGFVRLPGAKCYDPPSRFSGGQIRSIVGPEAECVRPRMTV